MSTPLLALAYPTPPVPPYIYAGQGIFLRDDLMVVIVENETHTLGNLIQAICFKNSIRDNTVEHNFRFVYTDNM